MEEFGQRRKYELEISNEISHKMKQLEDLSNMTEKKNQNQP